MIKKGNPHVLVFANPKGEAKKETKNLKQRKQPKQVG
jgi:hypothetical protein